MVIMPATSRSTWLNCCPIPRQETTPFSSQPFAIPVAECLGRQNDKILICQNYYTTGIVAARVTLKITKHRIIENKPGVLDSVVIISIGKHSVDYPMHHKR